MSYYELRARVASAFRAMKAMGISEDMVKPVLKSLLRLYGENWELIEKENYRTLADAIFERDELEAKEYTKEIVDDEAAGPSKKILNNYTEDCLGEEAQAAKEPGRPLKKLRLRYQDGQSSSLNTRTTLMPQTPLVIPKDEPNELPDTHLPKVNGSRDNVESPQPNGENITFEGSKGKQPISPKSTNSISRSQSVEMSYDELRARVESAFRATKAMGISDDKVKPVLKSLLRLDGENWELIEKENYRTLADAIFEREKLEAEEHTKEIVDDEVAGPSKKILNNYTEDCLGEEAQAIKEAQAAKEPGRPLKKLRLRYQYGQSSSLNTRNTLMPQTPLVIPKDEPNELPYTHLPKVNGSQDNVESPQPNGENITVEGSKGKQPISPKSTNSISRSQSVEMSYDELRARVASAFRATKAMGISDDKVKPVLKSLLRLYGENWELIEKENYRTLADAIFERDKLEAEEHTKEIEGNKGKQPISPKSTDSISRSQPNTQSRTESRSQHHPMRLRDRRKGIVYRHVRFRRKKPAPHSSSHAARPKEPEAESPKRKSTSSHALVKPKDEPITNMPHLEVPDVTTYPDKSNGGDTSRHGILGAIFSPEPSALQSVSESETSDDTGELAKDSNSSSNFEIASSSLGEVKISLCCDLASGRPDFKMPNLDAVLKFVEDKYLRTPQTLNPNISLMNLMKELCQGFLKLGTDPNSHLPKTIYSVSKSSAADALGSKGLSSSFVNGSIEPQRKTPVLSPACNGTNDAIVRNGENQEICTEEIVDIAKGHEKVVITLVNEVNDECPPAFHYIPQNAAFQNAYVNFSLARIGDSNSCATCSGDCLSLSHPCACSHETGGEFAYTADGLVKEELLKESISMNRDPKKHCQFFCKECPLGRSKCDGVIEPCRGHLVRRFIKECWWKCGCNKQCGNRVVQRGITRNLQVFMTPGGKGWGLRTLEDLPKGAFVCEYVGEVLTNAELFERVLRSPEGEKHSYPVLLDADWCAEGVLKDEEALCLDATFYGNIARFINHRCHDSTLVEIPVEVETPDHHYYHLAFFTTRKVKALEELTWDYGIDFDDHEHPIKAFRCQCGSRYCRNIKRSRRARR